MHWKGEYQLKIFMAHALIFALWSTKYFHGACQKYLPCDQAFQSPCLPNIEWLLLWAQGQTSSESSKKLWKLSTAVLPVIAFAMTSQCASCLFAGGIGTPSKMEDSTRAWRRKQRKYWWRMVMGKSGNQGMLWAIVCYKEKKFNSRKFVFSVFSECFATFFSCPADSSIGDLVTHALTHSLSEGPF